MGFGDAKVGEQMADGFGFHAGAAVCVQGELIHADMLLLIGLLDHVLV